MSSDLSTAGRPPGSEMTIVQPEDGGPMPDYPCEVIVVATPWTEFETAENDEIQSLEKLLTQAGSTSIHPFTIDKRLATAATRFSELVEHKLGGKEQSQGLARRTVPQNHLDALLTRWNASHKGGAADKSSFSQLISEFRGLADAFVVADKHGLTPAVPDPRPNIGIHGFCSMLRYQGFSPTKAHSLASTVRKGLPEQYRDAKLVSFQNILALKLATEIMELTHPERPRTYAAYCTSQAGLTAGKEYPDDQVQFTVRVPKCLPKERISVKASLDVQVEFTEGDFLPDITIDISVEVTL